MPRKLLSEYGPAFFWLAQQKETAKRIIQDRINAPRFSMCLNRSNLPVVVSKHRSLLLRELPGLDMQLQINKVTNLSLAIATIDGICISPGETFSLWHLVGNPDAKHGYLPGMVLEGSKVVSAVGGGLCQLSNMIHWLVLHTPMTIVELHHHTDALFPDVGRRVPFGTGTSIFYNYLDYRFENHTPQMIQLRLWLDETDIHGEIRATEEFKERYVIVEEDHHFMCEGDVYFRNSLIYRKGYDQSSGEEVSSDLILRNHSRVLYDPALIPVDQLR